jgi:hypothetical protein
MPDSRVRKNNEKEKRWYPENVTMNADVAAGVEEERGEAVEDARTPRIPETITPHGVIPPVINPTPLLTGIIITTLNTVNVPMNPKTLNPYPKNLDPFPLKNPNHHPLINPNPLTFQNPMKKIQKKNPF